MGYVGAVSSASLARIGHDVVGVDVDPHKLETLRAGRSPVVEPGLDDVVKTAIDTGQLTVTDDALQAVAETSVSWICVGTPSQTNGSVDLGALEKVAREIGRAIAEKARYHLVVVRSTVLPGTVRNSVVPWLEDASGGTAGVDFGVCMIPEFLREGTALDDFSHPPFTLIGELDSQSGEVAAEAFAGVDAPVIHTVIETAEMVKYAGNTFHALKVAFANEIGTLCKAQGVDGQEVMEIFARDTELNISAAYLKPGFAFGGSCLPKDTRALAHRAKRLDADLPVLTSLMESNEKHIQRAIRMVESKGKKKVGILGLSFKAGTDDVRESPVVPLIETLVGRGYEVSIYDSQVQLGELIGANRAFIEGEIPHIASLMRSRLEEVLEESEVVVVTNGAKPYREALHLLGPDQILIDLVGIAKGQGSTLGEYEGICW